MAIIAAQQKNFKKFWKMHYTRRLRSTHNMPQEGTWQEEDVVLIHDLSNDSGRRPPYPVLGKIEKFLTEQRGQAWIRYGDPPRYVSRPMALLTRVTGAADEIAPDGLLFDPLAIEDKRIQKEGQVGNVRLTLPAHLPANLPENLPVDQPGNAPAGLSGNRPVVAKKVAAEEFAKEPAADQQADQQAVQQASRPASRPANRPGNRPASKSSEMPPSKSTKAPSGKVFNLDKGQQEALMQTMSELQSATSRHPTLIGKAETYKLRENLSRLCEVEHVPPPVTASQLTTTTDTRPVDLPANLPAELPTADPADTLTNRGNHEVVPGDNALTPGYGSVRPHRARPQKQPYWHQQ